MTALYTGSELAVAFLSGVVLGAGMILAGAYVIGRGNRWRRSVMDHPSVANRDRVIRIWDDDYDPDGPTVRDDPGGHVTMVDRQIDPDPTLGAHRRG
jgi:hypothetical protein